MTISALIDKQDSFEVVRDKIGTVLVTEVASQMELATAGGKDPLDWKLQIYLERSNPWEKWSDVGATTDTSPIVNVWYDNSNFDPKASSSVERQKTEGIFNIDCYGLGISRDDGGTGHLPGDKDAALEVQRAIRIVRNILMAAEYTYLGLQGLVWSRWMQAVTVFQPQLDARNVQNIVGARLAFRVVFNEFSPQFPFETLELVTVDVLRAEDGALVAEADYSYPLNP